MKQEREAVVSHWPGYGPSRQVFKSTTIRRCERWIAHREKTDPAGVHAGDYCIGGTPEAEREYHRLAK